MHRAKSILVTLMVFALFCSLGSMARFLEVEAADLRDRIVREDGQAREEDEEIGITAEVLVPNKILQRTYMRTHDNALGLTTAYVNAFSPTSIACPVSAGCTIRVEVSSQFWDIDAGTVARMRVMVDGSTAGVEPDSLVNVDSTSTGGWANARTFQWMKSYVPYGNHTVQVQFQVSAGNAYAGYRMVTIEVFN
jgi:hypothetical protein